METKRELINQKLDNFKLFLTDIIPERNKHLIEPYKGMTIEQFVENYLKTYQGSRNVEAMTRMFILKLEMADIHHDKLKRYLGFFLEVLEM